MSLIIAIQGIKGSNHHQVAIDNYGEDVQLLECLSFDALVQAIVDGKADKGIMAIENSIAGSIIPNYNLIYHNNLYVVGEQYLNIHHNLMALKGQTIADISEVRSHPMALLQCKKFFQNHPHIKLVEDVDTAEPARRIQEEKLKHVAAIAPQVSSEMYGLNIVADDIQTMKYNSTRFIIVKNKNKEIPKEMINKASIRFLTDHKRGSLAAILNVMSDCNLNLTKIQSLPVVETPWKYAFFVDITFNGFEKFEKAKALLSIMSEDFKVLGEYKNARL